MKAIDLPFNVEIMNLSKERLTRLRPVSTTDISEGATSNFHEDGLFSVLTFGRVGSPDRDRRFSYIDIKVSIFHPVIYKTLCQLRGFYEEILTGRGYALWSDEEEDFITADETTGQTGFQYFVQHWEKIRFKSSKSTKRDQRIKLIEKYKDRALTNKILVMPAGLRDVRVAGNGRLEQDEINDLYRRLVGISRNIEASSERVNSPLMNYSRQLLQKTFNEIYDMIERMLTGKKGFILSKWGTRRVFNGTRNVISSMDTSTEYLGQAGSRSTDTVIGLFQMIKGVSPVTIHLLRNGWLSHAFGLADGSTTARLVDKTTLQSEVVELSSDVKDKWSTIDGLEKVIDQYQNKDIRHKPIDVEGRWLGLIYKGPDKTFRIFGDIRELPEHLERKHVHPLSLIELIYLSGYRRWNTFRGFVTRYPVTGLGSTYGTTLYTKTTVVGERRAELDENWQPMGNEYVATEFPTKEPLAFIDSQIISPVRLVGLGADFDGDTCSLTICYSQEALDEINAKLASKEAYLDPRGGLATGANVDTVALVIRNMTGD